MDLAAYLQTTSRADFCKLIGAHAPDLSRWLSGERPVPPDRCPVIERETGGSVTCEELRADVHWYRVNDKQWPHPKGRPCIDVAKAAA